MRAATPRWALSLADLCLLLLAFFVLLHARANDGERIANSVRAALGGGKGNGPSGLFDEPVARLFEPGEAMLTGAAHARFVALGARAARAGAGVAIESRGTDAGSLRLDHWELAAARTAAIARAVRAGGVAERNITVSIANATANDGISGQTVRLSRKPVKVGTVVALH